MRHTATSSVLQEQIKQDHSTGADAHHTGADFGLSMLVVLTDWLGIDYVILISLEKSFTHFNVCWSIANYFKWNVFQMKCVSNVQISPCKLLADIQPTIRKEGVKGVPDLTLSTHLWGQLVYSDVLLIRAVPSIKYSLHDAVQPLRAQCIGHRVLHHTLWGIHRWSNTTPHTKWCK